MFKKRIFKKDYVREEKGEQLFRIQDENGYLFTNRLLTERNADAMLNLVKQAYDVGLKDMKDHFLNTVQNINVKDMLKFYQPIQNNTMNKEDIIFKKRIFKKDYVRNEKDEPLFGIQDEEGYVFVDRLLTEKDSDAMFNLVKQTYDAGLKDMTNYFLKTLKNISTK